MKIAIDARMYGLEHAGIGRYIMNLVAELEQQDQKNQYFILLRKQKFQSLKFKNKNFQKILADYPHYSWQEQLFLPFQLLKIRPDLTHFPHFNVPLLWSGPFVVTIHDLIKHHSRGKQTTTKAAWLYWPKYWAYLWLMKQVVNKANQIITVSNWAKNQLKTQYPQSAKKIQVIYNGVGQMFGQHRQRLLASQDVLKKYQIKKPFIIYTGSLYPHKNVRRLAAAAKKVNINLVVVSRHNIFWQRFKRQVKKLKAESLITLTGFIPDDEVVVLYRQAEAFVFPSLQEGFGLPGLEAMAVGLPVLAANATCLPEIYGKAALYFDPLNTDNLAVKIKKITTNSKLRQELIKRGLNQVKKYAWSQTARETLKIYESCQS